MEVITEKVKGIEINDDNLGKVMGGFAYRDPGIFYQDRFKFTVYEVEEIKRRTNTSLEAYIFILARNKN